MPRTSKDSNKRFFAPPRLWVCQTLEPAHELYYSRPLNCLVLTCVEEFRPLLNRNTPYNS